ncbi:histidinol dehydrogenase [Spiribacter sp. 1M153]|jgi:histidinol dehydrogenase|uniref:histidinol dehydrogenase n=1 Tax=Spiribacter roseus TaxID=1855875 RepID=UPI000F6D24B4|nr:histidinol dehydrogenase [Spiribacter roseus]AUB79451.1 histidinol dehydrogenase [Spiribacter roseus]KAF0282566.1 histidinol dehydrogenase [Spiribacter roseus]
MVEIQRLSTTQPDFEQQLRSLTDWDDGATHGVESAVAEILAAVRGQGDAALRYYSEHLDGLAVESVSELEVDAAQCQAALEGLERADRDALETAAARIRHYHLHQRQADWEKTEADGSRLGQQVRPLERVGIYVPGGKAAYPSSVLMNAIPAHVAGVGEIIMVAPAPGGHIAPMVLAAAAVAGVDRLFLLGGAQAVAALAYGTETLPAVDKIVGPGNAYVAEAKRRVFGHVGIDMVAGPSEILIVCDGQTDPEWTAMDLFSQAEHDEDARALLICPEARYLDDVQAAMERLLPDMERSEIIRASLARRGAMICVRDLAEAADVANSIAPEHLELSVVEPERLAASIHHAGAIFLGRYTPEAFGDYCAGPSHVLPTSRTARFASPLGVYDFCKTTSLVQCTADGAAVLGPIAARLARCEGLTAHARSAEMRYRD